MTKSIDELYLSIADNILGNVPDDWKEATLSVERDAEDAIGVKGGFIDNSNEFHTFKFRNFDRRIFSDFHEIHSITTQNDKSNWNRAKYTLMPSGDFTIDFEWDQSIADEVEANS